MSGGGLFTNSELEAWRNHLELGDIHDALAKGITYSICREEGMADMQPRDIPTFQCTIHKPKHPQTRRIMEYLPKAR